jgi:hypothetical protein
VVVFLTSGDGTSSTDAVDGWPAMSRPDIERGWIVGALVLLGWVVLWVAIEAALFDGDLLAAGITGAVGGLTFALVHVGLGRYGWRNSG